MDTDVYVGNLGATTTEAVLRAAFSAAGSVVKNVVILRSPQTGRSRGFGFVRLGSEEEAVAVIRTMNGAEVEGQRLKVSEVRPRPRTSLGDGRRFDEDAGFGGPRRMGGARRSGSGGRRRR